VTSAEFSLSGLTFPLTIAAGQSIPFTLTFTPQTSGSASAIDSFTSNASNSTAETLTGTGAAPPQHSVDLSWTGTSTDVGYNVYRGSQSGGPYAKINSALNASTTYIDSSVQAGQIYYYVTTAVDSSGAESSYSNQFQASVPSP
jgi:fibronectin type 3 domain-containing protein